MSNPSTPKVGDWVRFMRDNRLVVGIVQYVKPRNSWERSQRVVTDCGEVSAERVLEVRSDAD